MSSISNVRIKISDLVSLSDEDTEDVESNPHSIAANDEVSCGTTRTQSSKRGTSTTRLQTSPIAIMGEKTNIVALIEFVAREAANMHTEMELWSSIEHNSNTSQNCRRFW